MLDVEKLQNDPANSLAALERDVQGDPDNLEKLDSLAEVYFELGEAEQAFPLLEKSVALDPEGKQGAQKFFWLGQILGGRSGIEFFQRGLAADPRNVAQVNEALLGMIEIWMTDLCMEAEAETQCMQLIDTAFKNTDRNAEAWSVLGSIRISQQKQDEARDALLRSWELFLEDFEQSRVDHNVLPKLLRLAQNMLEVHIADPVLEITDQLYRMDDQIAEVYYLNALAHQYLYEHSSTALDRSKHIVAIKDAAELVTTLDEPADPEIVGAIEALAASLPAPEIEEPFKEEDEAEAKAADI